jgi:hypothetical protein
MSCVGYKTCNCRGIAGTHLRGVSPHCDRSGAGKWRIVATLTATGVVLSDFHRRSRWPAARIKAYWAKRWPACEITVTPDP